jgi:hypothetical protein
MFEATTTFIGMDETRAVLRILFSLDEGTCGYSLLFLLFGYKFEIYRREGLMEMGTL